MRRSPLGGWETFLLATLIAIYAANAALSPQFLTVGNQVNLVQLSVEKIIVALVMAFVIIDAEIDLSVGSMMGLSACAFGRMVEGGVPAPLACALCLGIGTLGGLLNGAFVALAGLPSLVVTLATLIGFRGVARILVEDRSYGGFPDWFDALGQRGFVGPLPLGIVSFLVLFVILAVTLQRGGFGRKTYVIGTSREVADYAGIDTRRHKLTIFAASGLVAAYAGLLFAARVGAVRGDVGTGFELDVITMVLLGGVSIFGGSGTLTGVGLAILIVLALRNGMGLLNVTGHIQTQVVGLLLIASVLVPRLGRRPVGQRGAMIPALDAPIVRESVAEQVARRILDLVVARSLRPGDQLPPEREMAESLGVSRPSVREAMRGLSILGVVRSRQGGGSTVTALDGEAILGPIRFFLSLEEGNIRALYDARSLIEGDVARRAAQAMGDDDLAAAAAILEAQGATLADPVAFRASDYAFHEAIWAGCGNPFLKRIGESLNVLGLEVRKRASETPGVLARSFADHRRLLDRLAARDPEGAARAAEAHMWNVFQSTVTQPGEEAP